MSRRYCPFCDEWVAARHTVCPECGADTDRAEREPLPTDRDDVREEDTRAYREALHDAGKGGR